MTVLTSSDSEWHYLKDFLNGVKWYSLRGSIRGQHLPTYDFKEVIKHTKDKEGVIKYLTDGGDCTQEVTLKWVLVGETHPYIDLVVLEAKEVSSKEVV